MPSYPQVERAEAMVAKVHCLGPHTSVDVPSPPLRHTQVERAKAMVAKVHCLGPHTSVDVPSPPPSVTPRWSGPRPW